MIKKGYKTHYKEFTNVYDKREKGTLHDYYYFKNEEDLWIYNISFHCRDGFADFQLVETKRVKIKDIIEKARQRLEKTTFSPQPYWES